MEKSVAALTAAAAATEKGKSAPMEKSVAVMGTADAAAAAAAAAAPEAGAAVAVVENGKPSIDPTSQEDVEDGPEEVDVGLDEPRTTETSEEPWTINSRCLEYFGAGARGVNRVCKNNSFCNFEFVSNFTNSNLVIADSVRIPAHPHQRISRYERNSFSKFVSSIGDVNS